MPSPEDYLEYMWEQQEAYGAAVAELYKKQLEPPIIRLERARSGFADKLRAVERDAARFGRRDDLESLSEQLIENSYAAGALFVQERASQLASRRKLPDVEGSIRVDKATAATARVVASFNFSLADKRAVDAIVKSHLMWFTDDTGAVYLATDNLNDAAAEIISTGISPITIADDLAEAAARHYGVLGFLDKGLNYWAGVAEHAATTAAISGQLHQINELGFTRYTLVNPMDERTTPVCQMMNGKSLLVSDGLATLDASLAAKTPDAVRAAKPFVSGGSAADIQSAIPGTLKIGEGDLTNAQSKALGNAGLAIPPFHLKCRMFVDVDPFE